MVAGLKPPHSKPSFREPFLETLLTHTSEVPSIGSPKNYKLDSKIKTLLFSLTIIHSNWNTCLRSNLAPNTSSFCIPPNPAVTQPPHLSTGTHLLLQVTSYASCVPPPYVISVTDFMAFDTLFQLLSFLATKLGIPNHVVWAISSDGYTKPSSHILAPGALHVPHHVPTLDQSTVTPFYKRTPGYLIWLNHATL